jgi:hypothetical protein
MEAFIKALPAVIAAAGGPEEVIEAACLGAWKHAVGEALGDRAIAERFNGSKLVVVVEDKIWQRQLEQMRDQFLFRLNNVLGTPLVKVLEFRIAPEKFAGKPSLADESTRSPRPIPIELVSAAANIDDAGLRRAFLGAAVSCVNRLEKSEVSDLKSEI